ncbi:zf-HC2 domain-containing protein [Streptomyces minutiscleroticus]|uniref:zf-HC2 domain-containing protein n=1 Tax=Streptomyces minutiscleroticus TaxID=68238 RepID=UPI003326576D
MRSLERHRDAGAYALGVLDEADAFRFEDHLVACPRCTVHVSEFGPTARQLLLYREATPRSVHPAASPGPRLLDRLLEEVASRRRGLRRRRLWIVAAAVVFAVAGPAAVVAASGGAPRPAAGASTALTATDPASGVWARVSTAERDYGSEIDLRVRDTSASRVCELVAVGRDGSEETVAGWTVPEHPDGDTAVRGAAALHPGDISRFEVRTARGERLVTLERP